MMIDCGGGVFMGDVDACKGGGWDHVVHFVRNPITNGSCPAALRGEALAVTWRENEPIEPIARTVMDYARSTTGRLLVHCQSGHHRAPHGALLACLARGVDPLDAMRTMTRERWRLKGWCPDWKNEYLNVVMSFRDEAGFP